MTVPEHEVVNATTPRLLLRVNERETLRVQVVNDRRLGEQTKTSLFGVIQMSQMRSYKRSSASAKWFNLKFWFPEVVIVSVNDAVSSSRPRFHKSSMAPERRVDQCPRRTKVDVRNTGGKITLTRYNPTVL